MSPACRSVAATLFAVGLSVWTWKLLEPNPVPDQVLKLFGVLEWLKFAAAKGLHLTGYAGLTAVGLAAVGPRFRPLMVALMVAHGAASEIGQHFIPNRTGTVRDVVIDAAGVAAGALFVRWWTRRGRTDDAAPPDAR